MIKVVVAYTLMFFTWQSIPCPLDSEPIGMEGNTFLLGYGVQYPPTPGRCEITLRKSGEPTVDLSVYKYCGTTRNPATGVTYAVYARVIPAEPTPEEPVKR